MQRHNAELLNTQLSAEDQNGYKEDSSEGQIVERVQIEGTPFTAIRTQGKCFGVVGKYRITEYKETIPEVEDELREVNWNSIIRMMAVIITEEVKWGIEERIEKLGQVRGKQMRSMEVKNEEMKTQDERNAED